MTPGQPRTSTSRRQARTTSSVLDALSAGERSAVLAAVIEAHPDLVGEAEAEARRLLSATTVDDVTADVSSTLG